MTLVSDYFLRTTLNVSRPAVNMTGVSLPTNVFRKVKCSMVYPHDTDFDVNESVNTFRTTWVVFTEPVDIRIGDILVLTEDNNSVEYEVERVNIWGVEYLECRVLQNV